MSDASFSLFQYVWNENPNLLLLVTFLASFVCYYVLDVVQPPRLICADKKFASFLQRTCPTLSRKLWVTPFCFNGTLHTVLATFGKERHRTLPYKRELLPLADGGQVALDWLHPLKAGEEVQSLPIVIFLPGLNGDSQAHYLKTMILDVQKLGYRVLVFNNRGKGGVELLTPKTYCALSYQDLQEVVQFIKNTYPDSKILGVGTSLGGVILGQYLIHSGKNALIDGAVFVSTIFDPHDSTRSLESGFIIRGINKSLARELVRTVTGFLPMLQRLPEGTVDFESISRSVTIRDFDSRYTAPAFGFRDVNHYYDTAQMKDKLRNIRVPVLAINAADDPFQPGESLPTEEDIEGTQVAIAVTSRGGHLGFLEGFNIFKPSFSENLFIEFCRSIIEDPEAPLKC